MQRKVALLAAFLTISACASSGEASKASDAGRAGYRIRQSLPMHSSAQAVTRLELLEDARISPALRQGFQRALPDDRCDTRADSAWKTFCDSIRRRPLRPALIRIVSADRELDTVVAERPIADIVVVDSQPSRRLYGLVVDLTAEAGTYSGPYVRLLADTSRRLEWLRARDAESGQVEEIHLATTPKTAWKAISDGGRGVELFLVACRPRLENSSGDVSNDFQITYARYSFEDGQWRRHQRSVPGFWENEGDFPARSLFP